MSPHFLLAFAHEHMGRERVELESRLSSLGFYLHHLLEDKITMVEGMVGAEA